MVFCLKYDPTHLDDDELSHELCARNIIGLSSKREETKALRKFIIQENENPSLAPKNDPCNAIIESNKGIRALISIGDLLEYAKKSKNSEIIDQAKSRTAAWINRLYRLDSDNIDLINLRSKFKSFFSENFLKSDEFNEIDDMFDFGDHSSGRANENNLEIAQHKQQLNVKPRDSPQTRESLPAKLNTSFGRGRGLMNKQNSQSLLSLRGINSNKNDALELPKSQETSKPNSSHESYGEKFTKKPNQDASDFRTIPNNESAYFQERKNIMFGPNLYTSFANDPERAFLKGAERMRSDFDLISKDRHKQQHIEIDSRSNYNLMDRNINPQPGSLYLPENIYDRNHRSINATVDPLSFSNTVQNSRCDNYSGQNQFIQPTNTDNRRLNFENYDRVRDIDELLNRLRLDPNRPVPIYRWDARFSGDGNGYSLNEFIKRVEKFADDENMPRPKLLANIHRLLDSTARKWYWASVDEWQTWDDFVRVIRLHFLPRNYDFFLKEEIEHRLQASNEPFTSFITDMKILFQKANPPLSENYKLYIVQKNMLPDYSVPLATHNVQRLSDLIDLCKRIDESRIMMDRRSLASQFSSRHLVEPSCFPKQNVQNYNHYRKPIPQPIHAVENIPFPENNESHFVSDNSYNYSYPYQQPGLYNTFDHQDNDAQVSVQPMPEVAGITRQSNVDRFGNLLNAKCFRCEQQGHSHRFCNQPKTFNYCYLCGIKNYTVDNCPKGHKRLLSNNQNNPSQSRINQSNNSNMPNSQNQGNVNMGGSQ